MRCVAVALIILALSGCGKVVDTNVQTVVATATPRQYTAADVVAAFRAHGLAALDPAPFSPSGVMSWYDKRPQGNYTIETVVNLGMAGVVWVAEDEVTADTITGYVASLRDLSVGSRQFRHYRMANIILFFYFVEGQLNEGFLARYWVAFGTMP